MESWGSRRATRGKVWEALGHEYEPEEGRKRLGHHAALGAATRDSRGCRRGTVREGQEAALYRQDLTRAPGSRSSQRTTSCPQFQEAVSKEQDIDGAGVERPGMPSCLGG